MKNIQKANFKKELVLEAFVFLLFRIWKTQELDPVVIISKKEQICVLPLLLYIKGDKWIKHNATLS